MLEENPEEYGKLGKFWQRVPSYKLTEKKYKGNTKKLEKANHGARIFLQEDCKKYLKTTCGEADVRHKSSAKKCYDCVRLNKEERWQNVVDFPQNDLPASEKPQCAYDPVNLRVASMIPLLRKKLGSIRCIIPYLRPINECSRTRKKQCI